MQLQERKKKAAVTVEVGSERLTTRLCTTNPHATIVNSENKTNLKKNPAVLLSPHAAGFALCFAVSAARIAQKKTSVLLFHSRSHFFGKKRGRVKARDATGETLHSNVRKIEKEKKKPVERVFVI